MKILKGALGDLENHISPPMRTAITLPTDHKGIVVYVAYGAYQPEIPQAEIDDAVTEVARALALLPPPVFKPVPDYGTLYTWAEFVENANDGSLDDDDGGGCLATATTVSDVNIFPSDVEEGEDPPIEHAHWATHVHWCNK